MYECVRFLLCIQPVIVYLLKRKLFRLRSSITFILGSVKPWVEEALAISCPLERRKLKPLELVVQVLHGNGISDSRLLPVGPVALDHVGHIPSIFCPRHRFHVELGVFGPFVSIKENVSRQTWVLYVRFLWVWRSDFVEHRNIQSWLCVQEIVVITSELWQWVFCRVLQFLQFCGVFSLDWTFWQKIGG